MRHPDLGRPTLVEVIRLTARFELRLIGTDTPDGTLDADHLLAIVQSLKAAATRLARVEVDAAPIGRPTKQVSQIAKLRLGMGNGSTRIMFERSLPAESLDFDLADESAVDDRFRQLIEGIARDERPAWVSDSQAAAAAELLSALKQAANEVEFTVDRHVRATFSTDEVHRSTWITPALESRPGDIVTLVGRLEKVDLKNHKFRVRDDVGNAYSLPQVTDDVVASRLIGTAVSVTGSPDRDDLGRIVTLRHAQITALPDPLSGTRIPTAVSVAEILASADGPEPGGLENLSDEEADSFFNALGM